MARLNTEKLYVEYRDCVTSTEPVLGRKYTLTHSDLTADLTLTIGAAFAYDNITEMRDEVLAEWRMSDIGPFLYGYVYVGSFEPDVTAMRNTIFRQELPLALEAIIKGDHEFYIGHPQLIDAPIWIYLDSSDTNYNSYEYWGSVRDYR